ncbi:MAG: ATP-binding protein, partial [Anaerolineales bacterium]|nr:ATP-binding protein [Anaerolineales bacterium]
MLINFSVGNYRSFKDVVTLSMVAARITSKNKQIDTENVFQVGNVSLLKSASIYGANASGKSNLFRAFRFMRWFVLRSTDANSEDLIKAEPFLLSAETEQAPSFFEVIFVQDGIRYRYGFEVSVNKVHAEWLFRTVKRETELFWREDDNIAIKEGFK